MRFAELLIQYNGFLLIFSASGFLISLIWYSFTEKSKRRTIRTSKMLNDKTFDEKVFFDDFESLENPAMSDSLKPIFDKSKSFENDFDQSSNDQHILEKKFSKLNELPQFPILKKDLSETIKSDSTKEIFKKGKKKKANAKENNKEGEEEVQNLLNQIKKDIKNKKG